MQPALRSPGAAWTEALRSVAAAGLALLVTGLAALALAGCGSGQAFSYCVDNADCETNLTCFQNQCLHLAPVQDGLLWEVAPRHTPYSHTFRTPQRLQPLPFTFCEPSVQGRVPAGQQLRVDLEGELEGLPGRCVGEQQVLQGEFSLPLPAGKWRLTFHPKDGAPSTRALQLDRCGSVDLGELAPPPTTRVRFLPTQGPEDPRPRCGVRVQAFDPSTGDPLSRALELRLNANFECQPPTPQGWELEVAHPRQGAGVALVVQSASPEAPVMRDAVFSITLDGDPTATGALATHAAPSQRALLLVEDENGHPVDGVQVAGAWPGGWQPRSCLQERPPPGTRDGAFRSAFARPTGSPGMYELWLPQGPIVFEATPPAATHLAPTLVEAVGEAGRLHRLVLPRKARLHGAVTTASGPLAGARLLAHPFTPGHRPVEARADARGAFELWADPGPYALFVDPLDPELPYAWFPPDEVRDDRRLELLVQEPRVVAGSWRLPGAHVRAWTVVGGHALLVGEAVTDEEGRFVMRLRR